MSIWDNIGGNIKKAGKSVGGTIKKAGDSIVEEIKTKQQINQTKIQILDRFEMLDLKKICKDYGIGEPSQYEENFSGERYKIKVTRDDFIDLITDELTLEQIKNFSDKRKIKIWDILKEEKPKESKLQAPQKKDELKKKVSTIEVKRKTKSDTILTPTKTPIEITNQGAKSHKIKETNIIQDNNKQQPIKRISEPTIESTLNNNFHNIIEFLESDKVSFIKHKGKKEKYYQDDLYAQLRHKFDTNQIVYEAENGRHRLDILLYNSIGIEVKVYNGSKDTKRQLLSQITEYSTAYPKIIGLVINETNDNNYMVIQEIETILYHIPKDKYKIVVK